MCQRSKVENVHPAGLLQPLLLPRQIWTNISIGFVEGLIVSKGYSLIMVVMDRSKYVHSMALKHTFTIARAASLFLCNMTLRCIMVFLESFFQIEILPLQVHFGENY